MASFEALNEHDDKSFGRWLNTDDGQKPAEMFRSDFISNMKVAESECFEPREYWSISDQWKNEWEKPVQVPVNESNIPAVVVLEDDILFSKDLDSTNNNFKLPRKYIKPVDGCAAQRSRDLGEEEEAESNDSDESDSEVEGSSSQSSLCRYDMDEMDSQWLKIFNKSRILADNADSIITESKFEEMMEEIEYQCYNTMEDKIRTEEGLGIEYDDNVVCDVCRSPEGEDTNEMIFCDNCDICVHQACYGVTKIPDGSWLCRPCSLAIHPTCALCGKLGGAMKSNRSGRQWMHVSCALWVPEVSIVNSDKMEPISGFSSIPQSRWNLSCSLCRDRVGACIQCSDRHCLSAFHVTCAFSHGLEMQITTVNDLNKMNDVSLKAYCSRHTKMREERLGTPKKHSSGSHLGTPKKEVMDEQKNNLRLQKIEELQNHFYACVKAENVAESLGIDLEEDVQPVLEYWKLKRKANSNRPLMIHKKEESDELTLQQEAQLMARTTMLIRLRQDLERVRNLCYLVIRREKLRRQLYASSQDLFQGQLIEVLSHADELSDKEVSAIANLSNINSIYDDPEHILELSTLDYEEAVRHVKSTYRPSATVTPRSILEKLSLIQPCTLRSGGTGKPSQSHKVHTSTSLHTFGSSSLTALSQSLNAGVTSKTDPSSAKRNLFSLLSSSLSTCSSREESPGPAAIGPNVGRQPPPQPGYETAIKAAKQASSLSSVRRIKKLTGGGGGYLSSSASSPAFTSSTAASSPLSGSSAGQRYQVSPYQGQSQARRIGTGLHSPRLSTAQYSATSSIASTSSSTSPHASAGSLYTAGISSSSSAVSPRLTRRRLLVNKSPTSSSNRRLNTSTSKRGPAHQFHLPNHDSTAESPANERITRNNNASPHHRQLSLAQSNYKTATNGARAILINRRKFTLDANNTNIRRQMKSAVVASASSVCSSDSDINSHTSPPSPVQIVLRRSKHQLQHQPRVNSTSSSSTTTSSQPLVSSTKSARAHPHNDTSDLIQDRLLKQQQQKQQFQHQQQKPQEPSAEARSFFSSALPSSALSPSPSPPAVASSGALRKKSFSDELNSADQFVITPSLKKRLGSRISRPLPQVAVGGVNRENLTSRPPVNSPSPTASSLHNTSSPSILSQPHSLNNSSSSALKKTNSILTGIRRHAGGTASLSAGPRLKQRKLDMLSARAAPSNTPKSPIQEMFKPKTQLAGSQETFEPINNSKIWPPERKLRDRNNHLDDGLLKLKTSIEPAAAAKLRSILSGRHVTSSGSRTLIASASNAPVLTNGSQDNATTLTDSDDDSSCVSSRTRSRNQSMSRSNTPPSPSPPLSVHQMTLRS